MLVIREAQIEAFRRAQEKRFVAQLEAPLRQRLPDLVGCRSQGELRELITRGLEVGRRYGIYERSDIERLLDYIARFGPDLDTDTTIPWAGWILRRKARSGSQKVRDLDAYTAAQDKRPAHATD